MDTSYLAQQVNSSIAQLHGLFDEIGVPNHEREARESEVIYISCQRYRRSLLPKTWLTRIAAFHGSFRGAE